MNASRPLRARDVLGVPVPARTFIPPPADGGLWEFAPMDTSYRVLDDRRRDYVIGHRSPNFDDVGFAYDMNTVFPLDRLDELAAQGVIGRVNDQRDFPLGRPLGKLGDPEFQHRVLACPLPPRPDPDAHPAPGPSSGVRTWRRVVGRPDRRRPGLRRARCWSPPAPRWNTKRHHSRCGSTSRRATADCPPAATAACRWCSQIAIDVLSETGTAPLDGLVEKSPTS